MYSYSSSVVVDPDFLGNTGVTLLMPVTVGTLPFLVHIRSSVHYPVSVTL